MESIGKKRDLFCAFIHLLLHFLYLCQKYETKVINNNQSNFLLSAAVCPPEIHLACQASC